MQPPKIYCLSGLGVDHRAFQNIHIDGYELIHIPWIAPLKNESLSAYSQRLFETVSPEENYNLMGVSMGGMIAAEFAKIQQPQNLFLISTIDSCKELPMPFFIGGGLRLHQIIPPKVLFSFKRVTHFLFGVQEKEHQDLLYEILNDTDPAFVKWALNAILKWRNSTSNSGIKIHGDHDQILPLPKDTDHIIPNAGHFMIVEQGKEISKIIQNHLNASS